MLSSCFLSLTLILRVFSPVGATQDFRHISYEDLVERSTLFNADGVTTYSQLLFDVARQQVVVGARDNLYRLTLDSLSPLEHATWPAPPEKASICQDKGQTSQDCHNYIKVLLSNGKSLFTCGTNAFSPQCTWREIENINTVTSWVSGVAMCPYSPDANVTALLARGNAGLFAGSSTDFSGADPAIYRTLASPILRTHQYDSRWLNDPQFVGSFETEDHVYFLFRESAVEYINCGKKIYSRIARVCKKDPGGQTLMRDTWTTFSKARLNCSLPGEFPFYYDEIQGAAYHPDEGIIYATFTTPSNGIAGSAICAFNMSAVASAFNGPFKHQEHSGAAWEKKRVTNRNRQHCGSTVNSPPHQIMDNQRYQLMDDAVQSTSMMPLHTATLERFSHIAVDVTPTKLHRGLTVLYVATAAGLVKKISVLPRTQETCLVEVWGPLPSPAMTLQFLKDAMSLYIGMETGLLRIPAAQCHRHRNRQACLNAQEPYCGWNEHLMKCQTAPNDNHLANHWLQEVNKCPVLTDPVDGGWSAWSPWASCHHDTAEQTAGRSRFHPRFHMDNAPENSDSCQCQTRECNNPPAQNGGAGCNGAKVKVANCTVHGGWTAWSAWSACSQTCGLAMKTRRRSCTNPAPGFGGRVCVGHDHDEIVCIDLPPCSSPAKPPPPPQNGQWSPWGPWNSCSRPCNGGIRMRKRTCDKPSPREGGAECPGCEIQIGDCNVHPCTETKRFSGWTPWLAVNATALESTNSLYTEKRFRFTCRAQTDDPSSVRVQLAKEEERFCRNDGSCLRGNAPNNNNMNSEINIDGGGWSEWSSWLPCNQACGGGSQQRVRQCDSPPCEGMAMQTRICNTHSCPSSAGNGNGGNEWSCWTDWSECSVSCGIGIRTRTRDCLGNDECDGANIDRKSCEMPSCESFLGWDEWTRWSPPCDRAQQQHRKRQCLEPGTSGVCQGLNRQVRDCLPDWIENDVSSNALPRSVEMAGISIGAVIGGCIAGFFIGLALTALLCFFYLKRRKPLVPGSPHYISKQNPYVSVPLKEINSAKRQPSFSGSSNGNGTLRPKTNPNVNGLGSPKLYPKSLEYETATLKRNSHGQQQQQQQQQHIRADLDQDKYY